MNSEKLKGHILILITNILFAVNMPISKYLLPAHVPPEGLTIMRMAFACVMFWIVSLFTVKEKVPLKDLGMLFVCALCGVGINQGLFIVGLNRSSPVDASIIATAVPIFVLLLAAVILKEPITRKKSFGVFMGVSGGLLLVFSSTHAIDSISSLDGDMMMIVSGLMYAIYLVLSKPLSLRYSSVTMMKWMFLFTTLTLVPFTFRHVLDAPAFHREFGTSRNWARSSTSSSGRRSSLPAHPDVVEENPPDNSQHVQLRAADRRLVHCRHDRPGHPFLAESPVGCLGLHRCLSRDTEQKPGRHGERETMTHLAHLTWGCRNIYTRDK